MTTPTEHLLTLTDRHGNQLRGKVIYIQPKAERWRAQTATLHITCSEWLDPYWYDATYVAGDHSFRGKYLPQTYEFQQHGYRYVGRFERAR